MGDKKSTQFPIGNSISNNFEDDDFILNYKPKIDYVLPEPENPPIIEEAEDDSIDDLRDRTQKLINGFAAVEKLADQTQKRIDSRVKNAGNMEMKLDPVVDAPAIAAMKRRFPNKDPNKITYDDYKKALDCLKKSAPPLPQVTAADLKAAKANPLKSDFGGISNQGGQNRPEIAAGDSNMKPLDLGIFQQGAVLALFALLLPLLTKEIKAEILTHLITAPHKPI